MSEQTSEEVDIQTQKTLAAIYDLTAKMYGDKRFYYGCFSFFANNFWKRKIVTILKHNSWQSQKSKFRVCRLNFHKFLELERISLNDFSQ